MTWQPIDRINQAFLALEFAIKAMNYVELRKINKDEFDCATLIQLPGGALRFNKSAFNSYDDLILASQNLYSQALAASAVAMEAALQGAALHNNPNDVSERGQLRSLVYMIRSAFAHDMQVPTWRAKGPYARPIHLKLHEHGVTVDMAWLDGKPLELEHFGGPLVYWDLMREARSWIEGVDPVQQPNTSLDTSSD